VQVDWPSSGSYFDGYDSGGECGVAYSRRLPMPAPKPPRLNLSNPVTGPSARFLRDLSSGDSVGRTGRVGKIKLPWYSFDHGMVHLVMMSTEHDFG
jgi:hypothetical protein